MPWKTDERGAALMLALMVLLTLPRLALATLSSAAVAGTATLHANCRVIVTSTGTIGNTTRTITVVVAKTGVPATNAALAFPGIQADVNLIGPSVVIDGRDTKMADNPGAPTGTAT